MALPDSVREVIGARVGRLGPDAERVLSLAAVIGRDFDLDVLARATKTSEDDLLDILDAAAAAALVRELADTPGATTSPTPSSNTPCTRTSVPPAGPGRTGRWPRRWKTSAATGPGRGSVSWPATGSTPPNPSTWPRPSATRARPPTPRSHALAPADALRYYAQALDLYAQTDDPDPILGLDLAIGLGTAQRQTGDPAFRDTLLDAARRAADLGDTDRLVAAALANNRGFFSAAGVIDADKVEILELALDRLAADHPDRALVLATLCAELTYGSPLERRQALADEAIAIAEASGDDATIVRVLNHVSSRSACRPCSNSRWPGRPTPWFGPSASVTRSCCSGPLGDAPASPSAPGTSTRWTAASRSSGRSPSSSTSRP